MKEVLIPINSSGLRSKSIKESAFYSFFKVVVGCSILVILGLSMIKYEKRIYDLEVRITMLEIKQELKPVNSVSLRSKREANPGVGVGVGIPSWVKRTGEGDPILNNEYLDFLKSQDERSNHVQSGRRSSSIQLRSGGSGRRRGQEEIQHVRNHEDETFFTKGQDGDYIRPSGLKEIYERLPPLSSEVQYETPASNLQTRAGAGQGQQQFGNVQRFGLGDDQVNARVVRYDEDKESEDYTAIAAHFVADVSNFTANENPRLRNSNGIFQIWKPAKWMSGGDFTLNEQDGSVTVGLEGLYQIYAQIHYHDEHTDNSFIVEVNSLPLIQCTTTRDSSSCFTSGITELKKNDKIVIKNVGIDRFSIYKPEKSFFGLMRLGKAL